MAALWGGGAGHAGAGGTLPLRGASEPLVGNTFSSTQCLLAEDLHLASLEAETILEAGEFLETMQDYLDSSVISIIEDFSSLSEVKSHMDAENELSLLTAITDILDSTDDETLSPFDPIPESELLTSPREIENSSFQRFLSFSVTPNGQDLHNIEDFQEPGLYTIMSKKVEASSIGIPFSLSSSCAKLSAFSNNASNKAFWEKQKLFKSREQESPVLRNSDGEEEKEEVAQGCRESVTAAVEEMEPETDLDECGDPYIIAAENISLDELVRSVHTYCQPTLTVCLSSDNQSLAEKNLTGPLVLEIMPDGGQFLETKFSHTMDSSCITGLTNTETELLPPALGKELPEYMMRHGGLDRELDSYEQDGKVVNAALPNVKDGHPRIEEDTQKSAGNQKNASEPASAAPKNAKLFASKKDQVSTNIKKRRRKKSRAETRYHKTINCQQVSACPGMQTRTVARKSMSDFSFQKKEVEKTGGKELLLNQVSQTKETLETEVEWSKCVREEVSKNPLLSSLVSARDLPYTEEPTQNLGNSDPVPIVHRDVPEEPHKKNQFLLPMIEKPSSETPQMLPDCTRDLTEQLTKDTPCSENKEVICPLREAKPRPLSLSEYRQRWRQRQSNNDSIQNTRENRSASKWPSVPKLPTELADLPCLKAPLPSTKAAAPKLAKEPKKPADSTTLAPDDKASAVTLSMPFSSRDPPSLQLPSPPPIPVVPASKVCAFSHTGPQVPPTLSIPHVPPAPEAFLPAPPNHYNMGSSQPAGSSWSHFALLPANYQSLPPPPPPATEVCSPVFHTVPPLLPPMWPPPPPVPLPFVPALPYGSVEWAPLPQSSYWSGIPVPPPVLPVAYGDQGGLRQSPQVGTLHVSSLSEGFPGQQSTPLTLESSCIGFQNVVSESQSPPVQVCQVEAPLAVKAAPRKISDPRRQTQLSTVQSQTEVTSGSSQSLEKLPLSPSADKPSKETALTQPGSKGSTLQSLGMPLPVPPSHQIQGEHAGIVKFSKDFQLVEKNPELSDSGEITTDAVAQNNKKPPAEEHSSLSVSLAPGKQKEPDEIQSDVTEHALVAPSPSTLSGLQKVQKNGHVSKKTSSMWKNQPFVSSAQHKHNKDLVHSFINEIGIEASDLSSLLEQFEKTEAKTEVSAMLKKNNSTGNNGSEIQWEKKMVDRLHAPELINVAGLTPPATPPHQLWKPLVPASLLGQEGSPKDAKLLKSLNKSHWKAVAPVHVGSGEHDYCQLTVAQPKGGARWNVKQNLDITIKPIKTLKREVLDQTSADIKRPPATVRLNPAVPTCQNPREIVNLVNPNKGQTKDSSIVTADLKPITLNSTLLETSLIHPCKEALDHRTTIPRSMARSNDDPCSVLLSPAASPCQDSGESTLQQLQEVQQKPLASKRSLRCYRSRQRSISPKSQGGKSRRNRASRSFSSSSDGDSDSSSSSSSSSSLSSSSSSQSRSPPSKHWRRCRSPNSSSSSTKWSHSRGRSHSPSNSSYRSRSSSRSLSPHRRNSSMKSYNSSSSYEHYQRQKNKYKERAIEERRVVFIGKIHNKMTRSELRHRFSVFGDIEDCTLHFREHRDNFGFVTYRYAEDAFAAIEGGLALLRPDEEPFDLGFGRRRQFSKRSYADLDSSQNDFQPAHLKNKYDALDFDTLLKQAQRSLRR